MKKTKQLPVGSFVMIPLEDGSFGYGRALTDPYWAFYDYRTAVASADLGEIGSSRVLFRLAVRHKGLERWAAIGLQELEGQLSAPTVRFMQDSSDLGQCTIFDSSGMERAATPEECVGLERAAVWDPEHVEGRLLDHFLGRVNAAEQHLRVRLPS